MSEEINKEKRLEIYRKSSEVVQDLYSSEETGRIIRTAKLHLGSLDEATDTAFVVAVGDIILGLYKKDSLYQLLKDRLGLSDDLISLAISELKELLDKIPESKSAMDFISKPQPVLAPPPTDQTVTAPQPTIVKPMRTFPDDFNAGRAHSYGAFRPEGEDNDPDEPTHSTSQDDVLRK